MAKKNRNPELTQQDAERSVSAFLRPWLCRRFQQKKQIGYLRAKAQYIKVAPQNVINREGDYPLELLEKEAMQFKTEMLGEQRNQAFLIEKLSGVFRRTKATHIQKIKLMASVFLKAYRRTNSEAIGWCESDWMNDDELVELSQLAVFTYLESWLANDRGTFLTLERFTNCGYDGIKSREEYTQNYESRKAALTRAYDEYERMHRKWQEQKKELLLVTQPVRYKRENQRKLSLLDIAWCDAWSQRNLELLGLFFFHKGLSNRKSEHDARQNESLRNALNRHAQFIDQVAASYPEDKGEIDKFKEYVANCCLLQKLERHFYFSLAGHLADYATEQGCRPNAYDKAHLSAYISVYRDEEWLLLLSNKLLDKNGDRKNNNIFRSLRTLGFDAIVEQIFEITETEQIDRLTDKELMQRAAIYNLLLILVACFPFDRRSWTDSDFREAAEFLKTEYRFLDRLTTWALPKLDSNKGQQTEQQKIAEGRIQKFLDYYYMFFLELYKDGSTLTRKIVEDMTQRPARKSKQFVKS